MRYLLDTNAVIAIIRQTSSHLTKRVYATAEKDIALSAVVMHKLWFGAFKSNRFAHNLENMQRAIREFAHIALNEDDARVAGEIRADLALKGTPIGPYDALIAGQAKVRDLILVTNNRREFSRVAGLRIEDWTDAGAF